MQIKTRTVHFSTTGLAECRAVSTPIGKWRERPPLSVGMQTDTNLGEQQLKLYIPNPGQALQQYVCGNETSEQPHVHRERSGSPRGRRMLLTGKNVHDYCEVKNRASCRPARRL